MFLRIISFGNVITNVTYGNTDKVNDAYIVETDDKAFCENHLSNEKINIIKDHTLGQDQYHESAFTDQKIS